MPSFTPLAKRILKLNPRQETLPGVEVSQRIEKKRAREKKKNGRWAIVAIFLMTVLASLFFYLRAEWPGLGAKIFSPAVISTLPSDSNFNPDPVLKEIEALTADLKGTYGVYVYRFGTGQEYGFNEKQAFTAASLIKLPVLVALYERAEEGRIDLDKEYILKETDKVKGAGILYEKEVRTKYTYRQLAHFMGQHSDNTAFKVVREFLGDTLINLTIGGLGMNKTSLKENKTTPREISLVWRYFYETKQLPKVRKEEIFNFLTETDFEDRIPAGLPDGARVAHKVGTETNSFSDAGIIFGESPFVLVMMSDGALKTEADQALVEMTKLIWEFETQVTR